MKQNDTVNFGEYKTFLPIINSLILMATPLVLFQDCTQLRTGVEIPAIAQMR